MNRFALAIILAWIVSTTASAIEVLDQSNPLTRYMSDTGVGYNHHQRAAQTIRVGITGQLSRLDFWAHRNTSGGNGDLAIDIRLTEPGGTPIDDDSSYLGRVVVPRGNLSTLIGPAIPANISPFEASADLTPLNLFFQAGDVFAINFTNTDPSGGTIGTAIGVMGDIAAGLGPYAFGQAFLRNNEQNGGDFFAWEGGVGDGTVDLGFRTYMLVPEPSTVVLLASMLIGVAVTCSRVEMFQPQ